MHCEFQLASFSIASSIIRTIDYHGQMYALCQEAEKKFGKITLKDGATVDKSVKVIFNFDKSGVLFALNDC